MSRTVHGILRGRTIELSEELGMNDGQELGIEVRPVSTKGTRGERLSRSAGALADDPEWDGIMNEVAEARKHERITEVFEA